MTTQSVRPFRSEHARAEFAELDARRAEGWPVASETTELETPSGRTFVRASGCATDSPLILLSGMRGTSLMWKPNIAALSAGYRVYALEAINDVGWSVARREIKGPDDLVRWLDEVLGLLVPDGPVNIVGMSYGGWLASLYALRFPGRVRRVVLLAPGGTVLRFPIWFYVRVMYHALRLPGSQGDAFQRTLRWIFSDMVASGEAVERARPVPRRRAREDLLASRRSAAARARRAGDPGGDRPGSGPRPHVRAPRPRRREGARLPGALSRLAFYMRRCEHMQ